MSGLRLDNHTGKVIALGRIILSLFILVATRDSLEGPPEFPELTSLLGVAYVAFAALTIALTWSNWWLDFRLSLPAHLTDLGFFLAFDLSTGLAVTSPFFIFFVFLLLSAAARWGWRAGIVTGAVATLVFASETASETYAASLSASDYAFAVIRGGHLVVLTLMISWFGLTHLSGRFASPHRFSLIGSDELPVRQGLAYLAEALNGTRAALVWSDEEEPWLNIATWSAGGDWQVDRIDPSAIPDPVSPSLSGQTFLFDLPRRRSLVARDGRLAGEDGEAIDAALAPRLDMAEGLATPLEAGSYSGTFFVAGIEGMSWDDLPIARRAGRDVANAFDRWETAGALAEATGGRARLAVARDLHDSVSQNLAGIAMKLRAARTSAPDAAARDRELHEIEGDLFACSQQILGVIEALRVPAEGARKVDLDSTLAEVADMLRRQWHVEIEVTGDHLVSITSAAAREVSNLVREAVANSVRHGRATRIALAVEIVDGALRLRCQDNGKGFARQGHFEQGIALEESGPRSIIDRVRLLGGQIQIASSARGATVSAQLPLGGLS